jgi:hypothetical protein
MPGRVCRSCGADIRWAKTAKNKSIPVDPVPVADGNLMLVDEGNGVTRALPITGGYNGVAHKSHFATCPYSGEHRKR